MKNFILYAAMVIIPAISYADVYDDVASALRSGNASNVAAFFGPNVDLTILAQENMYSKVQAEQVLKVFFSSNTPKGFTVIHKTTSKDGSMFAIGSLDTAGGKYRASFLIKQVNGKNSIQELRIEKE